MLELLFNGWTTFLYVIINNQHVNLKENKKIFTDKYLLLFNLTSKQNIDGKRPIYLV